ARSYCDAAKFGSLNVRHRSIATETRCPRYVRLSLNLRHDLVAPSMTRMGSTGRAPAPEGAHGARAACYEKEHHHASHRHRSRSDRHRNRYGQEHASRGRPRYARHHCVAREGLTRTHYIEACGLAALSHWHRSGDGDALRCSRACRAWPRCEAGPSRVFEAFSAGAKNDFRDAFAVAEAVQRPTTRTSCMTIR